MSSFLGQCSRQKSLVSKTWHRTGVHSPSTHTSPFPIPTPPSRLQPPTPTPLIPYQTLFETSSHQERLVAACPLHSRSADVEPQRAICSDLDVISVSVEIGTAAQQRRSGCADLRDAESCPGDLAKCFYRQHAWFHGGWDACMSRGKARGSPLSDVGVRD